MFILYDDMGYGDIGAGAQGSAMIATPNIDQLAADGVVLSDFHSPSPVCTPSRAGYLTGRLAPRAGLPNLVFPTGSLKDAAFHAATNPTGHVRLPAEEITLADLLKAAGYATGMVGKWHLGDHSPSLPNDMGFDSYFGALYSNDMEPFALYDNREIAVPAPAEQVYLTQQYTEAATRFIEAHADEPFFLYFAHNFPHDPLSVRAERSGRSRAGLYGDVMEEIDDSVGALVAALRRTGTLENTLIIITSDNGPWFLGDAGNQRGRKGNTFEGGMRVPFIAHWPARISPGRTEAAMAMGIDLLPTVLEILQLPPPADRVLDGRSILTVLTEGGPSPHDYLFTTTTANTCSQCATNSSAITAVRREFCTVPTNCQWVSACRRREWLFDLDGDPREPMTLRIEIRISCCSYAPPSRSGKKEMTENLRGWK
ncbi:MAG: sulfatase [Haliea sp.]|nr:sulfatase [Haliea sp.]